MVSFETVIRGGTVVTAVNPLCDVGFRWPHTALGLNLPKANMK
ncbi:MAG: hypothetical protein Ct9H300mP16_16140 [Pseudomonadota bacterium]|nr:MAG: hypothetical protein Ct9H300mP16_16140 [Pseudomonadota bacterium]